MDELVREFVGETREMLDAASASLVQWEADPTAAGLIDEIFRFVHTVKGSCGFLELPRIGALAHAAEDVLAQARGGERVPDSALVGAMLQLIDRIAFLVEALETKAATPDEATDAALIAALTQPVPAANSAPDTRATPGTTAIRIPVQLLEAMMNQVSDLVLARNELARRLRDLDPSGELSAAFGSLTNIVGSLRDSVGRARLQPIERLFRALPRLTRDTAAQLDKRVQLVIEGDDVEIDREMVDALRDPLTHIVRNAVDHGLESMETRAALGKPLAGTLRVTARQSGNQVSITIADDGRGIDTTRLVEKAVANGIVAPSAAANLSPERALQLIFEPGLSTASKVTEISGRGVGMDVVRTNIERLGGSISVDNRPGRGLTIVVRVPLTLSILSALIVEAGGQRFAIPGAAIDEVVAVGGSAVRYERIGEGHVAAVRGQLLSTVPLARLLGLGEEEAQRLVIVEAAGLRYALPVVSALEHEELVVRPLAPSLASTGVFAGQSLPDDGCPLLLLDPIGLAERAGIERAARTGEEGGEVAAVVAPSRALTYVSLAGTLSAIRAAHVERIEDITREDFVAVGSETFVLLDGRLAPVLLDGPLPATPTVATLRLEGPAGPIARPVEQVCDLVPVGDITNVVRPGLEGLILVEGRPVPLLRAAAPDLRKEAA